MIFRQNFILKSKHVIFFFRKEIFVILLILLSLSSNTIDKTLTFSDTTNEKNVWLKKHIQDVKGMSDSTVFQQFREVEIVPVKYEKPVTPQRIDDQQAWGVAKQVDEHTWTMNVQHDEQMATPSEIISALNLYRQTKGRGILIFDQKLSDYASRRADLFSSNNAMDSHAGFQDFITNQDGFNSLGFNSLGENSSLGYQLEGTHLIEWVFAGDAPHDTNQLNPEWTHVGVGVNGVAVDIIFGGRKK